MLKLLGNTHNVSFNDEGELDLSKIFDENELINEEGECKEGAKAYKYYLRENISQLNALHSWNKRANELLVRLNALSEGNEAEAHYLISQLEIADQHAKEAVKAFTQYVVVKTLNVVKVTYYNDGTETKSEQYKAHEFEYAGILNQEENQEGNYVYSSRLADSYDSLEDLRKIQTDKYTVTRKIKTTCYKDEAKTQMADKYDDLAYRETTISDESEKIEFDDENGTNDEKEKAIALFGELPLLDKLKYIILYYKISDQRHVYPQNATVGFPCVFPKKNLKPEEDTAELGQLEMFYIGYLVDRDGPINALASFLEVKSVAIQAQIVLMSYRLKALQHYIKLLNKGFDALNRSQASTNVDEYNRIPRESYNILAFLGANTARSLLYLKDDNGKFLSDEPELQQPFLVIQYVSMDGKSNGPEISADNNTYEYHFTGKNDYILVEASEEGIDSFFKFAHYVAPAWLFQSTENIPEGNGNNAELSLPKARSGIYANFPVGSFDDLYEKPEQTLGNNQNEQNETQWKPIDKCYILHFEVPTEGEKLERYSEPMTYLPKELEIMRSDVESAIKKHDGCKDWNQNDADGDWGENVDKRQVWTAYVGCWTKMYSTVISNYQTQLDSVQKSVDALRRKINTIDSMSSSFRKNAYTIYNKIVNKVN